MTQKTLSSLIFILMISLISSKSFSINHSVKALVSVQTSDGLATHPADENIPSNKTPFFPAPEQKVPHGKAVSPNTDELPHIHKFHKERVKKIKKHHSKFWIVSKLLLVLCHLSILVLAFVHATH